MDHQHASSSGAHRNRLAIVFGLTLAYLIAEVVGAYLTNSLALLADAAHMATDVGGIGLALFAIWFAERPAHSAKSYGYYRVEVLAALINGALLLAVGFYVVWEAWKRLSEPPEVGGGGMIVIAGLGLVVNLVGIVLLRKGASESLNVQGAFLEVVADALGSVAVIVAGVIIWQTGWWYADPLFSVGIGLFVIPRTLRLMGKAVNVLLEGSPDGLDVASVQSAIGEIADVEQVHDLHVWSISSGIISLSAHVRIDTDSDSDAVLDQVTFVLAERFDIHHTTIQIERATRRERLYHQKSMAGEELA